MEKYFVYSEDAFTISINMEKVKSVFERDGNYEVDLFDSTPITLRKDIGDLLLQKIKDFIHYNGISISLYANPGVVSRMSMQDGKIYVTFEKCYGSFERSAQFQ